MLFETTPLSGLIVAKSIPSSDTRGAFTRLYCQSELSEFLSIHSISQVNHSITKKRGTVRGLHFQYRPYSEIKFVRCLRGRAFDVAVDLRINSPTFLQWHSVELSATDSNMIVIPEGFAHGFQSLENDTELLYLHTNTYHKPSEGGLNYKDPKLGIRWPLSVTEISERDINLCLLNDSFVGL